MERRDIRAFAGRDWQRVADAKDAHWLVQKRDQSASQILAAGAELRRHALKIRRDWPSARERADDLEMHRRVSEALRAVGRQPR